MIDYQVEKIYWEIPWGMDYKDFGGFDRFYSHEWKVLFHVIEQECRKRGFASPQFSDGLKKAYISQMQKMSLRTLVFEMHASELCGELHGVDEKEKYDDYLIRFLCDACYVQEVYSLYPELYKEVIRFISNTVNALMEVIDRFEKDRDEINDYFFVGNKCSELVCIDGGDSDRHNGGRKVYILELDNGERLVYKPRNMKVDEVYGQFVQWVSESIGIPYSWNKVMDKKEYGWSEWVAQKECDTYAKLERYYLRNGILICVSYLLGSEDIHYENLIAHGEYPIIIDLEMGIGSRGYVLPGGDLTETERIYRESVLQTGLLPLYTWNENGEGVNVSAISGGGGQLVPFSMPKIVQAGTVNMHIEYVQPEMGEGKNLATMQGTFIEPVFFVKEIQDGFRKAYQFLCDNKNVVFEWLNKFRNTRVRYLIRDTQQYSMIMSLSYAPRYLENDAKRASVLEKINPNETRSLQEGWTRTQEVKQLSNGDIPYFWYDPFEKKLVGSVEGAFEGYFSYPIITCLKNRLKKMDEIDMSRQLRFIHAAISMGGKMQAAQGMSLVDIDSEDSIQIEKASIVVAERIADYLLENAIWSEDKSEVGWISIMMTGYQERSYLVRPMNLYLYDGLAGVALFLMTLFKNTGRHKYREVADVICNLLFSYTDKMYREMRDDLPTGAFSGEGSIVYVYGLLYTVTKEEKYLHYLKKHCLILKCSLAKDKTHDVLGGNAGAVLVFLYAFELTNEQAYLAWAKEAGEILVQNATCYAWGAGWVNPISGKALTGFAHGAAGVMLALLKLGHYSGERVFYDMAERAVNYEDYYYDEAVNDWADLRHPETNNSSKLAWCHGKGGILAARKIGAGFASSQIKKRLLDKVSCINVFDIQMKDKRSFCLCHGGVGIAAILSGLGIVQEKSLRDNSVRALYKNVQFMQEMLNLQEHENYGFLGGMTGIGYACISDDQGILDFLYLNCRQY